MSLDPPTCAPVCRNKRAKSFAIIARVPRGGPRVFKLMTALRVSVSQASNDSKPSLKDSPSSLELSSATTPTPMASTPTVLSTASTPVTHCSALSATGSGDAAMDRSCFDSVRSELVADAHAHLIRGDFDGAIALCDKTLFLSPRASDAFHVRGRSRLGLAMLNRSSALSPGQLEKAVRDLSTAISSSSDRAARQRLWGDLSDAQRAMGNSKEAQACAALSKDSEERSLMRCIQQLEGELATLQSQIWSIPHNETPSCNPMLGQQVLHAPHTPHTSCTARTPRTSRAQRTPHLHRMHACSLARSLAHRFAADHSTLQYRQHDTG